MTTPGASVISRLSVEFVIVPVNAVFDGVTYNPVQDTVQFAFTVGYGILPTVWYTGSWDVNAVQGIWYNAKILVGPSPSAVQLSPGTYTVWVKITDNPEVPVRQAGSLIIQ
jgi:hypothetical protein